MNKLLVLIALLLIPFGTGFARESGQGGPRVHPSGPSHGPGPGSAGGSPSGSVDPQMLVPVQGSPALPPAVAPPGTAWLPPPNPIVGMEPFPIDGQKPGP